MDVWIIENIVYVIGGVFIFILVCYYGGKFVAAGVFRAKYLADKTFNNSNKGEQENEGQKTKCG
jgi:hypothetical protein